MSKKKELIAYWFPVIGWMIVIFLLSSRQRIAVSEGYLPNFLIFKTLHIIEYAILYVLSLRLLAYKEQKFPLKPEIYLYAFLIAILYAATDELHQTFIPSREGTVRDIFIDTLGISLMYGLIRKFAEPLHHRGII